LVAYLVGVADVSVSEALHFVYSKRLIVDPNLGFRAQLEKWSKHAAKIVAQSLAKEYGEAHAEYAAALKTQILAAQDVPQREYTRSGEDNGDLLIESIDF
jgi:hypothetical protein